MQDKTNVMRILDQKKIQYTSHYYNPQEAIAGLDVANLLNENPSQTFKTLVTVAKSNNHYVFVIPVECELDLKKAAKAVGEKNVEMIKQKELLPLTGYIHGGCSPIGMKKSFSTVIDSSALDFSTIIVSAGRLGAQVELNPKEFEKVIRIKFENITI